jgi:hypothetical protein
MNDPGTRAIIIAGVGTVVVRADGSAAVTDRNRVRYELSPEIVRALAALAQPVTAGEEHY